MDGVEHVSFFTADGVEADWRVVDAMAGPRKPHGVLPRGVIHFGSIGLSNGEALASATTVVAQACGVADRKGTIAQGFDADLIAVAGNPLQDLEALLHVRQVIRMGRLVHQNRSAGDSQVAAPTT